MTDRTQFEAHFGLTLRQQQQRHKDDRYTDPITQARWEGYQVLAQDAARWRSLINSARIRPLGTAGIREPEEAHYAHLGLELWTVFGMDLNDSQRKRLARENAIGQELLIAYADIAELAAMDSTDARP